MSEKHFCNVHFSHKVFKWHQNILELDNPTFRRNLMGNKIKSKLLFAKSIRTNLHLICK